MKLGLEPKKKKNTQESEHERLSMLNKRIERARAIHELAQFAMGTILLLKIKSQETII